MPGLLLQHPWRRQPQQPVPLNQSKFSGGIVGSWLAYGGAPLLNAADPSRPLTVFGSPSFPVDAQRGRHVLLSGALQYLRNTAFTVAGNGYPLTLATWFRADSLMFGDGNHTLIALTPGGGTGHIFQLYVANSSLLMRQYNSGSAIEAVDALTVGRWYFAAAVYESVASRKLYLDNDLVGTDTVAASAPSGINQIDIGASPWAGPGEFFRGAIASPMVINRSLSLTEVRSLRENTFQIFKAPARRIWVASGGGVAADLRAIVTAVATANASLKTQISLAANGTATASATAALATSIPLAATVSAAAASTATITTGIAPAAIASGSASATASLSTQISLAANVGALATTAASLSTSPSGLAASAIAKASASASLTTGVALAAVTSASATSSASLATAIRFASVAVAKAQTTAALSSSSVGFSASAVGSASASAGLTTQIRMAAQAVAAASVAANLAANQTLVAAPHNIYIGRERITTLVGKDRTLVLD